MSNTPPEKKEEQAAIPPEEETQKKHPLLECLMSLVITPETPEKYRENMTHLNETVD